MWLLEIEPRTSGRADSGPSLQSLFKILFWKVVGIPRKKLLEQGVGTECLPNMYAQSPLFESQHRTKPSVASGAYL